MPDRAVTMAVNRARGGAPRRRAAAAAVLLLGVVLAACDPAPPPDPPPDATSDTTTTTVAPTTTTTATPPSTTTTTPATTWCGSAAAPSDTPSPQHPVRYGARVDHGATSEVVTFVADSPETLDREVARLGRGGRVRSLEVDPPVHALAPDRSDDPLAQDAASAPTTPVQWHLTDVGIDGGWSHVPGGGAGVVVAVLDTGVDAGHEDLAGQVLPGRDFVASSSGVAGDGTDLEGHGSFVAGLVAAADNTRGGIGLAPASQVLPVRVLDATGSGSSAGVAAGIDWAVAHGAQVINLSLGGSLCSEILGDSIAAAQAAGAVVVAAAGNTGKTTPLYPAAFPGVIAVGAVTDTNQRATFSTHGSSIDLAAPGNLVVSSCGPAGPLACPPLGTIGVYANQAGTAPAYETLSGTSFSSPIVSAIAALVIERCASGFLAGHGAGALPAYVAGRLTATAQALPGQDLGAGLVRADAATAGC